MTPQFVQSMFEKRMVPVVHGCLSKANRLVDPLVFLCWFIPVIVWSVLFDPFGPFGPCFVAKVTAIDLWGDSFLWIATL